MVFFAVFHSEVSNTWTSTQVYHFTIRLSKETVTIQNLVFTKRLYRLKQTFSFQLQVCLSWYESVDTSAKIS